MISRTSSHSVIQGYFPQGVPVQLSQRQTSTIQPSIPGRSRRPPTYEEITIQAHLRSSCFAGAQKGTEKVFALPPHMAGFGRRPGQKLPSAIQQKMESVFGADFSDVEVHVGPEASSIGALAFTRGADIHFAPGQYNPNSHFGQKLLAHELTHVLQQRAGRVRSPFTSGVTVIQDPVLEAEAERMGTKAAMHAQISRSGESRPATAHLSSLSHAQVYSPWSNEMGVKAGTPVQMMNRARGRAKRIIKPQPQKLRVEMKRRKTKTRKKRIDLSKVAEAINKLHGYNDISTLAVAQREDGTYAVYTQRGYEATRECAEVLENYGIPPVIAWVESSGEAKYNMHAEMLAVSEWLAENQPKPIGIGASRGICKYCNEVLTYLEVKQYSVEGNEPPNWANPYWYNNKDTPEGLRSQIPDTRYKNRDHTDQQQRGSTVNT